MNATELKSILADEIHLLRAGKRQAKDVNAIVNAAAKLLSTVRLELDYAKMIGATPQIPFIPTSKPALTKRRA